MAEWVKLWTTFHDDPSIQNCSAPAIVYYVNALSWCGRHDSDDGIYRPIGKPPRFVDELVQAGKFEPLEDGSYAIHGWASRQNALSEIASKRREAGRRGGLARAKQTASKRQASASSKTAFASVAEKRREEKNIEQASPVLAASGIVRQPSGQQLMFTAVCEAMGYENGLGTDDKREIGGIAAALVDKGLHAEEVLPYVEWLVGPESPIVGGRRLTLHSVPKWVKDWRAAPRVVNGNGRSKADRMATIQRNLAAMQARGAAVEHG